MNIDSEARGAESEARVEQALEIIKNKAKKGLRSRIVEFIHARRHSELDRQHIDFLVRFESGHEVPLQVKSSERGRRKFERVRSSFGRYIPVVVVKIDEAIESIVNKVVGCLRLALNKIERGIQPLVHQERMQFRRVSRKPWCVRHHAPLMCH